MKALLRDSGLIILPALFLSLSPTCYSNPISGINTYTSCSQLPNSNDQNICRVHKQNYHSTIVKIPSGTQDLGSILTTQGALYIFDGTVGQTQEQATYLLPHNFTLPSDCAMIGNNLNTKAEFGVDVASASMSNPSYHFVLTTTSQGRYHFANIEFDSRNPTEPAMSASLTPTPTPTSTPPSTHSPQGVLNLNGAMSVLMDRVKVVADRASSTTPVHAIRLGCEYFQTWTSTYQVHNSEVDLTSGLLTSNLDLNAAFESHNQCSEVFSGHDVNGMVRLNIENTTTVLLPDHENPDRSTGVVFDINFGGVKSGVFQFGNSINNRVVDNNGADISSSHMGSITIQSTDSDRHQMDYCTGIFGVGTQGSNRFWGWRPNHLADDSSMTSTTPMPSGTPVEYSAGFAASSYWSGSDYQNRCGNHLATSSRSATSTSHAIEPTATSMAESMSMTASISSVATAATPFPTLVPTTATSAHSDDSGQSGSSDTVAIWGGVGAGVTVVTAVVYQAVVQAAYYHTQKNIFAVIGLGLPYVQDLIKTIHGKLGSYHIQK